MELYVVFEMAKDQDIMVAVFLDSFHAKDFVDARQETRYVVPIPATKQTVVDWYKFREKANSALEAKGRRPSDY